MLTNFFLFYSEIKHIIFPLRMFHLGHFLLLLCSGIYIYKMLERYQSKDENSRSVFMKRMGIYFLLEEAFYTVWVLICCPHHPILEIIPLQLCSMCVYMNVLTIHYQKDYLKFFCAIISTTAGLIAMLYPANLAHLYPVFSYRTINFYLLHATFIVFGVIQMKQLKELKYHFVKQNMLFLSGITCLAYAFNLHFHTDFMFIGAPPKIHFIYAIYKFTGILFIPVVLLFLFFVQFALIYIYRLGMRFIASKQVKNNP